MSSDCCPDASVVIDVAAGLLSPEEAQAFDEHVDGCSDCYELLVSLGKAQILGELETGAAPAEIGRYQVRERLGAGSIGVVYAAYDPTLDRNVALKLLGKPRSGDARDFLREARNLARLAHPNVTTVYDAAVVGEHVFIAMEFVSNTTVRRWLETPREWQEVVAVFRSAGQGLLAAHESGLAHRDFKPDNVVLGDDGVAQVTDFGLVGFLADPPGEQSTQLSARPNADLRSSSGTLLGSPAYMAPEQFDSPSASAKSDQFSFAASLYVGLFGQLPFAGDDLETLRANVQRGAVRRPTGHSVPKPVVDAVLRGLAVDPDDRYPTLAEMIAALEIARPRRYWLAAVLATVLLALVVVAIVVAGQRERLSVHPQCASEKWRSVPIAAGVDDAANGQLANYHARLARVHERLCEEPQAAFIEKINCVADLRDVLTALADRMGRSKGVELRYVRRMVGELASPSNCERLVEHASLRARPAFAEALWSRWVNDQVDRKLGDWKQVMERADALAAEAIELGYTPLATDALILRAKLELELVDRETATATAQLAASQAEEARADHRRAEATLLLLLLAAKPEARDEEIATLAELTRAAIARSGAAHLERVLEWAIGVAHLEKLRLGEALASLERGLAIAEEQLPADDPDLAQFRWGVSVALASLGRLDEARSRDEETLKFLENVYDQRHPRVIALRGNLALQYAALGDCAVAEPLARSTLAAATETLGRADSKALQARRVIATCLFSAGDWDGTVAMLKEEQLLHGENGDQVKVAELETELARAHYHRGNRDEAAEHYARAIRTIEAAVNPQSIHLANPLSELGELMLERGRSKQARELLERAVALGERAQTTASNLAGVQFALARALWGSRSERSRALELAKVARAGFALGGSLDEQQLSRVEGWLRERSGSN